MNGLLSRLWNAALAQFRRWFQHWLDSDSPDAPASSPPELKTLRRQAASLCAAASQCRLELAELLRQHDHLDSEIRRALRENKEAEAGIYAAQLHELNKGMAAAVRQYELQRKAAEASVDRYREKESGWRKAETTLKSAERMERSAEQAETLFKEAPLSDNEQTGSETASSSTSSSEVKPENAANAARKLLESPPVSERMGP